MRLQALGKTRRIGRRARIRGYDCSCGSAINGSSCACNDRFNNVGRYRLGQIDPSGIADEGRALVDKLDWCKTGCTLRHPFSKERRQKCKCRCAQQGSTYAVVDCMSEYGIFVPNQAPQPPETQKEEKGKGAGALIPIGILAALFLR